MMTAPLPAPPSSPHAVQTRSVARIMFMVWAALLPASLFGIYQFGWPALNLLLLTTLATLASEALCLVLAGKSWRVLGDGSALLTAWLLAMSLPPWAPWWIGVLGGVSAAILGKQVFGGIGQNIFNPAMLARVMLLIAFPLEMTSWVSPQPLLSAQAPGFSDSLAITFGSGVPDAMSGATLLGHARTELSRHIPLETALADTWSAGNALIGTIAGSLGETSALLIAIGGVVLIALRIITWHIPVAMLASVAVVAAILHGVDPQRYAEPTVHLLSGGLMLGAFFIATDPVTSPSTAYGQLVFGTCLGLLVYAIRTWGGYPEGLAFGVLIMNAMTPLIDHYVRPRIYGRRRDGNPVVYKETGS